MPMRRASGARLWPGGLAHQRAAQANLALADGFQPGHGTQQGGFATARANQHPDSVQRLEASPTLSTAGGARHTDTES